MTDNGEHQAAPRLTIDPQKGSLGDLQRMEELAGYPADKWKDAPRAAILIAALVVYLDVPEDEARAMSLEEAMSRVKIEDTTTP